MRTNEEVVGHPARDADLARALYGDETRTRLAKYRFLASSAITDLGPDPEAPVAMLSAEELAALDGPLVDALLVELADPLTPTIIAGWVGADRNATERDIVNALMAFGGLPILVEALEGAEKHTHHLDAVLRAAGDLSVDQLRQLDESIATWRDVSLATFRRKVARAVQEISHPDPVERIASIAEQRCVTIQPERDGSASLTLRGPAPHVLALYQRLSAEARLVRRDKSGEIVDPRTLAQLRFDLLADAAVSGAHPHMLPLQAKVSVTVPVLTALGRTDDPGEMLGFGPIDADTARELAGGARVWERILTDPGTGQMLPATANYTIPAALRRHVELRHRFCTAPGCSRRAALCEVDHIVPFDHEHPECGGQTEASNLHPLCTFHHQAKTQGRLLVERTTDDDGALLGTTWHLPDVKHSLFVPDDIDDANLAQVEWLAEYSERLAREHARRDELQGEQQDGSPGGPEPPPTRPFPKRPRAPEKPIVYRRDPPEAQRRREALEQWEAETWPDGRPEQPEDPPF